MAIDREAQVRIRIAMTGGEAGTAIDRIVARMEAVEKRLGAIGSGALPAGRAGQPALGSQAPLHVSPTPLPVSVVNFPDAGLWSKITSFFGGGQHRAGGGFVQRKYGSGGDDEPCYLTPGELVIPADVAQRLKQVMGSSGGSGRHYAIGGWHSDPLTGGQIGPSRPTYHLMGQQQSVQPVYIVNFNDMPLGGGGGGVAGPAMPGSPGWASRLQGGLANAQRISGAAGASNAAGLFGAAGNLAGAAAAGGPVGIAVAGTVLALEAFKVGIDKTTAALEIMGNSRMSEFQKTRTLEEEFVPLAGKMHALADALNQVHEKFRVAADQHALAMADIAIRAQNTAEMSTRRREVTGAQATTAGMHAGAIVSNRYFDINAPGGERAEREFGIRQQAQNALVHAERGFRGSQIALDAQGNMTGHARTTRDAAMARTQEAERALRIARSPATIAADDARHLTPWQRALSLSAGGYAAHMAMRHDPRPRINIAAHGLERANSQERATNEQYLRETDALQQRGLDNERQRLALAQARLGLTKAEAEIERARANQMTAQAQQLGGMGRAGRRQALRAFQVAQARGWENVSPETMQRARAFDSVEVDRQQRMLGERFLQQYGHLGGATMQEDWRPGNNLEQARRRASELEARVQVGTDRAAIESADRIGDIMANSLLRIGDIIKVRIDEVEREMRAKFAQRNNSPGA